MVISFYVLAAATVISALMVVMRPNPMHSALWLLVTFVSLAGIYILLSAEFVAAIQVIIYAGGILVLYIFVIMLVDLSKEASLRAVFHQHTQFGFALAVAALVLGVVAWIGLGGIETFSFEQVTAAEGAVDTTRALARGLFIKYLYPFEVASILLLVAMIGAVILARRSTAPADEDGEKDF